jgi:hypothetical protein
MKRIVSSVVGISIMGALVSCAAESASTNNCPPAAPLMDTTGWDLGMAQYSARREGNTITVSANGQNSTAGYQVQLAREPMKNFPPQFALYRKRPAGMAAQVITPFSVCTTFKAGTPVDFVTVRDSKGSHQVEVKQVQ